MAVLGPQQETNEPQIVVPHQMGTRGILTFLPPNCPELTANTLEEGCLRIIVSVMLWMQKHYLPDRCSSLYTDVAALYWEHGHEVTCIRSQSNRDLKRSCWLLDTSASVCVHLYKGFVFKNKEALKKPLSSLVCVRKSHYWFSELQFSCKRPNLPS